MNIGNLEVMRDEVLTKKLHDNLKNYPDVQQALDFMSRAMCVAISLVAESCASKPLGVKCFTIRHMAECLRSQASSLDRDTDAGEKAAKEELESN